MAQMTYPYDPSGIASTNLVSNEVRSVQPPSSVGQPSFIILENSPFFIESLTLYTGPNKTGTKLIEGSDYFITHRFVAGSNFLGKEIAGGVGFTNSLYSGTIYANYQTLGGDFTVTSAVVLEELTRRLYPDIRFVTWDQLTGVPSAFPPDAHQHVVTDIKTMDDIYYALRNIAAALVTDASGGSSDAALELIRTHLANNTNAHSAAAVGLGNVANYPIATIDEAKSAANNRYATPQHIKYLIDTNTSDVGIQGMKDDITTLQDAVTNINQSIAGLSNRIVNINSAISDINNQLSQVDAQFQSQATQINAATDIANNAATTATQALAYVAANEANLNAIVERVNKVLYVKNSFLAPGTHQFTVPAGTAVRVTLIGGGGGSGKYYNLSSDAIVTSGALTSGQDSVLWYLGTDQDPVEPIPLLIAGAGRCGNNGYGGIGRIVGGAAGQALRFKDSVVRLSQIVPTSINLSTDLVAGPADTAGTAGADGDTSNTQNIVNGVGGYTLDSSGDGYHLTYGRGHRSVTRAGAGGSAAKWYIDVRNDLTVDAVFNVVVGRSGQSARATTAEDTVGFLDTAQTNGVGLLTLIS